METQSFLRKHKNGVEASVIAWPGDEPRFAPGITTSNKPARVTKMLLLEDAKKSADDMSGCPQPCACPPWTE